MTFVLSYSLEASDEEGDSTGLPLRPYAPELVARNALGFGLLLPFQRDGRGDFAAGSGVRLVADSIAQILGVRCSNEAGTVQGELPWRPEFGSLVDLLRHRPVDDLTTRELARVYTAAAIQRWEPRVRLSSTLVTSKASQPGGNVDTLCVRISYSLLSRAPVSSVDLPPIAQVILLTRGAT